MPATQAEINAILGDVDPLILERLLATGATADEISEAVLEIEDIRGFGEDEHAASSARVAEVRVLLDELEVLEEDLEEPEQ